MARRLQEESAREAVRPAREERRRLVREWALALGLALLAALLIRMLFFEAFRIPSESMEETLQVGDFILVSKFHYGARLPVSIGIPFTNLYIEGAVLPEMRLPGFSRVRRNDVIVFNVPTETQAIDRKTHYIKRVIGLPGDSLSIVNKIPYAGEAALPFGPTMKYTWQAVLEEEASFPMDRLKELEPKQIVHPHRRGDPVRFEATAAVAAEVGSWPEVAEVETVERHAGLRTRVFPYGSNYDLDNYGPLYIPARGDTLRLDASQWDRYKDVIIRYEGHQARKIDDDTFEIDGRVAGMYVVEQDYYFVMGDNRDSSLDSRAWGFVPKDHIVGKALLVYFSWDPILDRTRTERLLTPVR